MPTAVHIVSRGEQGHFCISTSGASTFLLSFIDDNGNTRPLASDERYILESLIVTPTGTGAHHVIFYPSQALSTLPYIALGNGATGATGGLGESWVAVHAGITFLRGQYPWVSTDASVIVTGLGDIIYDGGQVSRQLWAGALTPGGTV